jgi:hypothetical protein
LLKREQRKMKPKTKAKLRICSRGHKFYKSSGRMWQGSEPCRAAGNDPSRRAGAV